MDLNVVRDVVNAYILLLSRPQSFPVFNICSEHAVPIRTILDTLCELARIDVEVVTDPNRLRANENPIVVGSSKRIREATGWKAGIPLRQTLNDLLQYWEERLSRTA